MSVVVERPYRFVPPHHGNLWPSVIQRLRLVDFYLRRKEGVVSFECRHAERLKASIDQGHGILLAPNHCRYADPLVMGWLARETGQHVYAMASWHLFNKNWFDRFSIPTLGGFSIWREGLDRQSLEMAINLLADARRPLLVFPEGTTNRTNDHLQPLLDGVPFMTRAALRRRAKGDGGKIVIHPIGIKYLFRGDIVLWASERLTAIERQLTWHQRTGQPLLARIARVAEGLLSLKEIEYLGRGQQGTLIDRRDHLIETLLAPIEMEYVGEVRCGHVLNRVRACRAKIVPRLLDGANGPASKAVMRQRIAEIDLAQKLASYPPDYLAPEQATDTRVLETVERMHEDFLGKSCSPAPLHAVIEVDHAIPVTDEKPPRGGPDPLIDQLTQRLAEMLARLSTEAQPLPGSQVAAGSPASSRINESSSSPSSARSRESLETDAQTSL